MDNPADRYDIDAAVATARKRMGRTRIMIVIMGVIIGYFIASVIRNDPSSENIMIGIFLGAATGFYFFALLWNARVRCKQAWVIIKTDQDGIFAWNQFKQKEINRLSFSSMIKAYWAPSPRISYISIIGMKDGKETVQYFSKIHMDSQSFTKELLSKKTELVEEALSREEARNHV